MAIDRKLGLIIVTAALLAVTMGCGSSSPSTDAQSAQPAAAVNESGKEKKISPTLKSGAKLTGNERDAILSAKGHGEP